MLLSHYFFYREKQTFSILGKATGLRRELAGKWEKCSNLFWKNANVYNAFSVNDSIGSIKGKYIMLIQPNMAYSTDSLNLFLFCFLTANYWMGLLISSTGYQYKLGVVPLNLIEICLKLRRVRLFWRRKDGGQVSQKEIEFDFVSETGHAFVCVDLSTFALSFYVCSASTSRFAFN